MCHLTRMLPNSTLGYSARSDVQLEPHTNLRWCRFKVHSLMCFSLVGRRSAPAMQLTILKL